MSQHIEVKGIYRNNKINMVGTHNPKNNRFFNDEEVRHLENTLRDNIYPNLKKFKGIEVCMWNDGKQILKRHYDVEGFGMHSSKSVTKELIKLYGILV